MFHLRRHWFLVALVLALVFGFQGAPYLATVAGWGWLKWSVVSITMFVMAWPLEFASLKRTVSRPVAPLLACGLNLGVIPILMWGLAPLAGAELGPGMLITAATPCTLASAAVWTRRAGGNDGVAIMTTLLTNGTCFLVMPMWIFIQTGNSIDPEMLTGTIYKLFFFVVLPIGVAQTFRIHRQSAAWATEHKLMLSLIAMLGILVMVMLGSANMAMRLAQQDSQLTLWAIGVAGVLLALVHSAVFWFGYWLGGAIGLPRDEQIAIGFAGSQKTLMIGLSVAISFGMSIIPIVMYHSIQLILDTVFADWIRRSSQPQVVAQQGEPG